ncbi:MAG: alcohol dehydrogenase catalytic domain-containing protein [Thermoproteota archaeon]|nr:alcohol dehydrogenase catalytic domain-containing protein [Candidatus Brockarchaeota archaeon]MBO3801706.1 alcohol dehydrogenase catalytic domain-containing protein [Candidatus Brockarchaeota archaeon]
MKKVKIKEKELVELEEYSPSEPSDHEVRLKVAYCGICGSDVHAYFNEHPFISLPIVPGHECSATVEKLGGKVSGLKVGQKVTFIPQLTCGKCYNCRNGRYNICENLKVIGAQVDGAMTELFNVDSKLVVPLPDDFDLMDAALIEPLAVAIHAVKVTGSLFGENVLILGAGTIGLLLAQVSKFVGASSVMITDVFNSRLKLAKQLGADFAINSREFNLTKNYLRETFGEREAGVIFEAVGIEATIKQAVELVRKGGRITVVGVFGKETKVNAGLIQDREINIRGSLMYLKEDFEDAVELIRKGKVHVKPFITHIFELKDASKAFETAAKEKEKALKVLIKIS